MELDAVGLSRAASSCRQLRHFVHQHAGPLWRNRLEAEGIKSSVLRQPVWVLGLVGMISGEVGNLALCGVMSCHSPEISAAPSLGDPSSS